MEKMIQIAESYGWAVDMDSDSIEFNQCLSLIHISSPRDA